MTISKKELAEHISFCMGAVDNKVLWVEGSDTIIFNGTKLCSYNDKEMTIISMNVPEREGLNCAVRASDIQKVVNKLSDDELKLNIKGEKLVIKSGKTQSSISLVRPVIEAYIEANKPNEEAEWNKININDFYKGIIHTYIKEHKKTKIPGVFLRSSSFISGDGSYISRYDLSDNYMLEEALFWFDSSILNFMLSHFIDYTHYIFKADWMFFKTDNRIFGCRTLNRELFPLEKIDELFMVLTKKPEKIMDTINIPDDYNINAVIDRLDLFRSEDDNKYIAYIAFKEKDILFYAENAKGNCYDVLTGKTFDIEDSSIKIEYPITFLNHGLSINKSFDILKVKNDYDVLAFSNDNWMFVFTIELLE